MTTQHEARTCRFCPPVANPGAKFGSRPLFMSAAGRVKHEKQFHKKEYVAAKKEAK